MLATEIGAHVNPVGSMATKLSVLSIGVALMLTSCSTAGGAVESSTALGSGRPESPCLDPPAAERTQHAFVASVVEPNPVASGAEATLSVSAEGLPKDAANGVGAAWQCWNGSEWITTHWIVRGSGGQPQTRQVELGVTMTIPAVALRLPNTYPILIPNVSPGTYRIEEEIFWDGGLTAGYVIVDVQ